MLLIELRAKLAHWAATKPLVEHAWIFGSRARGQEQPGSDLDIAIELDLSAAQEVDESGGSATWMLETGTWETELAALFPYEIDLEQFMGDKTPIISGALKRSSALAYEKSKSTIGSTN
jgi:uncharacterized protein